MSKVEY